MKDCITLNATRKSIDMILERFNGNNYVQCMKCGSIKADAKELLKTLVIITEEAFKYEDELFYMEDADDSEIGIYDSDGQLSAYSDYFSDLLYSMVTVGFPEKCYEGSVLYDRFIKENQQRLMPELNKFFEDAVLIDAHQVILKVNDFCGCPMSLFRDEGEDD
ncbi:MAG: hypothetical protein ABIA04_08460 [Pseudomonadota bacterium]